MIFGESSERKQLEQQRRSEGRLPPGQSLTLKWPVLQYGDVPRVDLRTWDFRIDGLVENRCVLRGRNSIACQRRKFNATSTA